MIDEKKRRKDWNDIAIEIYSNMEKKTLGWSFKPFPDYFLYVFMKSGRCYLLPALLLKLWVKKNLNAMDIFQRVEAKNHNYTTLSYAVPIDILLNGLREIMNQEF